MKVKQIKKIFLTIIAALSFGISNQAYGFFIDYNAQWMANQGLKNAREQEKRDKEGIEAQENKYKGTADLSKQKSGC